MVGALTAMILGFEMNANLFETQIGITSEKVAQSRENIEILPSSKPSESDRLYVQVHNKGNTPVQITDLWVINKNTSPYSADKYEIEYEDSFVSPGSKKQILTNTPITLADGIYDIKVVTNLGTVVTRELASPLWPLNATLSVSSPHIANGQNSTVFMEVVNRGNATVWNVKPSLSNTAMVDPSDSIGVVEGPVPEQIDLEPQEGVVFKWDYQLYGAVGTDTLFINNATGTDSVTGETVYSSNSTDLVEFVPAAKTLLQTPDINVVVPFPFGETGTNNPDTGLWGIVISNPTDVPIDVRRIIISAISPAARVGFLETTCDDSIEVVSPTVASEWSCPGQNLIKWENTSDPETIPARDAVAFLAKLESGDQSGSIDDPALLVSATVFSTFGQSSRSGLVSSLTQGNTGTIVNVYMSDPSQGGDDPLATASILGVTAPIASGTTTQLFNVTLADFSANASNEGIAAGTLLIVNVPSGFRELSEHANTNSNLSGLDPDDGTCPIGGPRNTVEPTEFADGSNQFIACLIADIGTNGDAENTFVFTADVPAVSSDAVYLMSILSQGETTDGAPVGAIAEGVIRVQP